MKMRHFPLVAATMAAAAMAAALAWFAPAPAVAARDTCIDALNNLYNNCWLHLAAANGAEMNYMQAYDMCENESNVQQKVCWTSCARNNADCGKMAACIDKCFNNTTMCSFIVQFVYSLCKWHLPNPISGEPIDSGQAEADCRSDTTGVFACYKTCAYEYWNQCLEMDKCSPTCVPTDDDTIEPGASPEPDSGAPIRAHGSACGC